MTKKNDIEKTFLRFDLKTIVTITPKSHMGVEDTEKLSFEFFHH